MIRGMSYNKGIFFMNKQGISHATLNNGKILSHYYPFGLQGILFLMQRLLSTLPLYIPLLALILLLLIEQPSILFSVIPSTITIPKLPEYALFLFVMAYHFIFPMCLRKYHGAEHKVFSYRGRRHLTDLKKIAEASIVNRNCSTNAIVMFFITFFITFPFVNGWLAIFLSWLSVILIPRFWRWGDQNVIFPVSAFLQRSVTTAEPEDIHLKVAILSYMSLQAKTALTEEKVWQEYHEEQERIMRAEEERLRREHEKAERIRIEELGLRDEKQISI